MDWSLFKANPVARFLRPKIFFPPWVSIPFKFLFIHGSNEKFYYFAIINNCFCRLGWTLSVSVGFFGLWFSDGVITLLAVVEVYR
jgi:hypothetical protein